MTQVCTTREQSQMLLDGGKLYNHIEFKDENLFACCISTIEQLVNNNHIKTDK